jgi:photosystem II stability/assembly factor-like uncharacterized protein
LVAACLAAAVAQAFADFSTPHEPQYAVYADKAKDSLLLDSQRAGERVVAVGERGHILFSDDDGRTWKQAKVPTRVTLTAVYFPDANDGWAVGHDSTILHSADRGSTWTLQFHSSEFESPLLDVWFRDPRNGFAIGAYGQFLVTVNGGESWAAKRISDDDYHLNGIAADSEGRLFIAAEAGQIYRSEDGGVVWESLPSPYIGSFFGIAIAPDDRVLVFGLRGHLFSSDDHGDTWAPTDTGTESSLMGSTQIDTSSLAVVGLGGTVLLSRDDGRTFTRHVIPDRTGLASAVSADASLLLFGETGIHRLALPSPGAEGH